MWGKVAAARALQHHRLERAPAVRRAAAAGRAQRRFSRSRCRCGARCFRSLLLHEPLSRRKVVGLALGMLGMGLLLVDDIRNLERAPVAALLILGASISWALGIVLVRKWKLPLSQTVVSGWMILLGWVPLAILAPFFGPVLLHDLSGAAWFAIALQHLPRRHARALGVLHARAHAAGCGVVDVLAAGADRRRVRPECCSWASVPGPPEWVALAAGRRGDGCRALDAEAGAFAARAGQLARLERAARQRHQCSRMPIRRRRAGRRRGLNTTA